MSMTMRRSARRVLVGAVLGAAALLATSPPAQAAVTAAFLPGSGALSVFGDGLDNTITISRDAAGKILVNGGAVTVTGGTATVANTTLIKVFGQAGNDQITINEANGALPAAKLFGGDNNDTLAGGSGADQLLGQAGNDTLLGKGGNDVLLGDTGNDTLTAGDGNDQAFGQAGNDRMVWNPGDDTDLNEGGDGIDTVEVNGGNGTERFTAIANGTRVRFDRLDPAPFSIDLGTDEKLIVNANGGDDRFSATGNLAALISITVDGGAGNDQILGSNGADRLLGGAGDDFVDGQAGNDVAFLGAQNDVFQWNPGNGNDTVEGQDGTDTLLFNGSAANEIFAASANGGRLRFSRDVGNIVMDTNDIEAVDVNALGGTDALTVNNLAGTDVVQVDANLAGVGGGGAGDGLPDTVVVKGTAGNDAITVVGAGTSASVIGLSAAVNIANAEAANDTLTVSTLAGNDNVTASTLPAGAIKLTIDGGANSDTLLGSQGADVLRGGDGDDLALGDGGDDVALMGAGNDVFEWNPGDGSDTVEGQDGADTMLFFGANIGENIDLSANGGRVRFSRDIAAVTMDMNDVESTEFRALGGADNVVVGDLTGTDLTSIRLDLRGSGGGGDAAADTITVNGTAGADLFGAAGDAGGVHVSGLKAKVDILFPEKTSDRLTLNGLGGDDVVDATALKADAIQLTMNGGLGVDRLLGSEGDDLLSGGDGNDVALAGPGNDTFLWNPGDDNDTLEGQSGFDAMLFNGANISEHIDVSANGQRIRFTRDVASVTMDLGGTEAIQFNALGGADTVVVNDVSGTDLVEFDTNLAGTGGVGDGQPDNVIVNGTDLGDVAVVAGDASGTAVTGLAARVDIVGAEAANDRLTVQARDGDDVVDASGVAVGAVQLTLDGGPGNDVLIGGDGDDTILGGPGDDVLTGGPGNDVLDGGPGDNIILQLAVRAAQVAGGADTITSATVADADWTRQHVRIVDGKTVIKVGGKEHTLPHADLSQLLGGTPT